MSNPDVFNDREFKYWVGFPRTDMTFTWEDSESNAMNEDEYDENGNLKRSSAQEASASEDLDVTSKDEEARNKRFDTHDCSSFNGMARCLDWRWLRENLGRDFIRMLKENENRQCNLPDSVLDKIRENMMQFRFENINYVYKYRCQTMYQMKFCNAVTKQTVRQNRNAVDNDEILFDDEVTKDWLYTIAVEMNNCQQWYNDVVDPTTTNKVFPIPVGAVTNEPKTTPVPYARDRPA